MKEILINGEEARIRAEGLPTMAELIELIKGSIDPAHMITSIILDGRELEDQEWMASPQKFTTSIIEIETGDPREYALQRMAASSSVVEECYSQFRSARHLFQEGDMQQGNSLLKEAVGTLQAFFQWYSTMLELLPEEERRRTDIDERANELSDVCRKICQQQLYQSWWALGETLEQELEPKLDKLQSYCRQHARGLQ